MDPDRLFDLFDTCIELAECAPPNRRAVLVEIAEQLLKQANDLIEGSYAVRDLQNAPTTSAVH
jgi:hypothetical protein